MTSQQKLGKIKFLFNFNNVNKLQIDDDNDDVSLCVKVVSTTTPR